MPKRRQRQDCNCGKSNRPKPGRREKHLYVILDDIENGYSIHKLDDLSRSLYESEEESDSDNDPSDPKHLPEPPALRLGLACHENMFFAALGTSIFMATTGSLHPSSMTQMQPHSTLALASREICVPRSSSLYLLMVVVLMVRWSPRSYMF
jgi:hypothetical protein